MQNITNRVVKIMKKLFRSVVGAIVDGFHAFESFYLRLRDRRALGHYEFTYTDRNAGRRAHIFCNGPSLMKDLEQMSRDAQFATDDKVFVNFSCNTDLFFQYKPKYYCLADPAFFTPEYISFFSRLNELVTWDITLFIPFYGKEKLEQASKQITNRHITLRVLSITLYGGNEKHRFRSWKKGTTVPSYVNISIMALYITLNLGYTENYLYGVDHTFFEGMGVDDDNHVYLTDSHYYDAKRRFLLKDGEHWPIKDWLYDKYLTFLEHERMRRYADYLGSTIINCTAGSLIDAYERLSKIRKNKKK